MLLLGATGKSAQIPLFVWLPDAMAGPTPVSALIHAATMVTAGIYMIARTNPLWHIGADAAAVAAWIGGITALMAATIALVQTDIKRILAYSTISQLGYMMLAVGVAAYGAGIFHLTTHAFFKALLFLGAGSIMHALHGETDIRKMGGLRERLPTTYRTFAIGAAALAGVPLLSGFFSKDEILVGTLAAGELALYLVGFFTALLTVIYAARAVVVMFQGSPRQPALHEHAHESPRLMTGPLWVLAFLSIVGGILNLPGVYALDRWLEPSIGHHETPSLAASALTLTLSIVIVALGLGIAYARYIRAEAWTARISRGLSLPRPALEHAYFVDEFYWRAIVRPLWALAQWFSDVLDAGVVDGVVNGIGRSTLLFGGALRRLQSGYIPAYVLSIFVGAVVLVLYFVFGL
jgi:NADH-quinone oxidoreductase subunit L